MIRPSDTSPATPATPVALAVAGAFGRMGRAVARTARQDARVVVVARFDRDGAGSEGLADGPLLPRSQALAAARVVVDFTTASASAALAREAADLGGPALVIGSTGFDREQEAALEQAAARIAVLRSGNFSLGVNLLAGLVRRAAAALDPRDFDIEVFEAHHRRKVDAPSGAALMLGEAAAAGRGVSLAAMAERARDGIGAARAPGAIGFCVMRGGGIVGEHSVVFAGDDEIITLSHSARDRALFARGALAAAVWIADKPPGLYDMQDVLGLKPDDRQSGGHKPGDHKPGDHKPGDHEPGDHKPGV